MNKFPPFGKKIIITIWSNIIYNTSGNNYLKEFDFQFSDITDEEMTLLIDMLIDSRDVYS